MPPRKSQLTGEPLRVALLDAAGHLLRAEGPHALSTRRLAAAVGTSTQSIYTLFGAKDGVVRAMYREGFARLAARMRAVAQTDDPLLDLYNLGLAYRDAALASPHLYDVMFGRPVAEFECDDDDRVIARVTHESLRDGIARGVEAGWIVGDPDRIAIHLWVTSHGFVSLELAGYLDGDAQEREDAHHELLVASLAPFLVPNPPPEARLRSRP